jgi:hypothetical protein
MNPMAKINLNLISNLLIYFVISILSGQMLNAQNFKLYAAHDLDRIYEDGYKLPNLNNTVNLFGIRGEVISGQVVIHARKALSGVTVELND